MYPVKCSSDYYFKVVALLTYSLSHHKKLVKCVMWFFCADVRDGCSHYHVLLLTFWEVLLRVRTLRQILVQWLCRLVDHIAIVMLLFVIWVRALHQIRCGGHTVVIDYHFPYIDIWPTDCRLYLQCSDKCVRSFNNVTMCVCVHTCTFYQNLIAVFYRPSEYCILYIFTVVDNLSWIPWKWRSLINHWLWVNAYG